MTLDYPVNVDPIDPAVGPWYCGYCYREFETLAEAFDCPECRALDEDAGRVKRGWSRDTTRRYGSCAGFIRGKGCGLAVSGHDRSVPMRVLKLPEPERIFSKGRVQFPCLCRGTVELPRSREFRVVDKRAVPKVTSRRA